MTAQPTTTPAPQQEQARDLFADLEACYARLAASRRPTLTVVPAPASSYPEITINESRPAGEPLTATCHAPGCGWTHSGEFFERVARETRFHLRSHSHPTPLYVPPSSTPTTTGGARAAWGPDTSFRRISEAEDLRDYPNDDDAPDGWDPH